MKKKGITLIEILVTMTASAIIFSLAAGSFVLFSQTKEKLKIASETQKEIAFIFSRIGDKIKSESISYKAYQGGSGTICENETPHSTKNLCTPKSEFIFKKDNLYLNNEPLFSDGIKITEGIFSITPSKDPFASENKDSIPLQKEPLLSVSFKVESKIFPEINFQLQTSFSSRQYQ